MAPRMPGNFKAQMASFMVVLKMFLFVLLLTALQEILRWIRTKRFTITRVQI